MAATLPSSASIDPVSSGLPIGLHQGFASMSLGSRGGHDSGHSTPSYNHAPPTLPPPHSAENLQYAPQSSSHRRAGVCKFFNSLKGFGFVVDARSEELGGQEVFCHFSAISGKGGFRSLAEGEEVEYDLVQGPKGFQASNLTGPGGRSVVGDPKARLSKPQTFMPFAPLSMPLSSQYISDSYQYQQQPAGVYASSPYTQHVLYVPTSMHNTTISIPPSQYAYTAITHQGSSGLASPPNGMVSAFIPSQYPQASFGGAFAGGAYQQSHASQRGPSGNGSGGFGTVSSYGGENGANGRSYSPGSNGPISSFAKHGGGGGGSIGSIPFAPFNSPPAFTNPALFSPPPSFKDPSSSPPPRNGHANGNGHSTSSSFSLPQAQSNRHSSSSSGSLVGAGGGFGSNGSAILFGSNPSAGVVGAPRSNASGGGSTPREERREERRGTPLGNGTLPGVAGNAGSVFGPPILYASDEGVFS